MIAIQYHHCAMRKIPRLMQRILAYGIEHYRIHRTTMLTTDPRMRRWLIRFFVIVNRNYKTVMACVEKRRKEQRAPTIRRTCFYNPVRFCLVDNFLHQHEVEWTLPYRSSKPRRMIRFPLRG